ncbi:hypothetical protein [Nocardioides antri]|uniref:Uncharacterized protein n=1 Tax=Nocardioides antri TaxID=2607659 RepID=A0A5B1LU13_9ACTN|nr:hypothetical protein [Nocardioides antri]KAA1424026.1 hypothetical protein F0U47_20070 [Nocardioides antri]
MPTRYVDRSALVALLRDSRDPLAERATAALDPTGVEMVPVTSGGLDSATYEVRLARAEASEGPRTGGLRAFVEALARPMAEAETLSFRGRDGSQFIVLLDSGQVVAITVIESA